MPNTPPESARLDPNVPPENQEPVDNEVTTEEIADGAVTTAKIADANVTTAKIADTNVTAAKLSTALQNQLADFESRIAALESA